MKFYEYKAKEIFKKHGIPVPHGVVVSKPSMLKKFKFPAAIKAQVLVGGRGRAGGIKFAEDLQEARRAIEDILKMEIGGYRVREVLVEEKLDIERELYLGITIDRRSAAPLLMTSLSGGVDVESVPDELIFKQRIPPLLGLQPYILRSMKRRLGLKRGSGDQVAGIAEKLFRTFVEEDAELVEINPLAVTRDGRVVAGDAKLIVDDNALFRHAEYRALDQDLTPLEMEAMEKDIAFIQLGGDIGVIANGAGLTMATLDALNLVGGSAGVFLDLGGTDDPEKVKQAFRLMKKAKPSVVLLNIFGGITKCDTVAQGVAETLKEGGADFPVVARIKGLNEERAHEILRDAGILAVDTFEEAARAAVEARRT